VTFDLPVGWTLCDPPASADELKSYCIRQGATLYGQFGAYCSGQTDRNMGGTTCCLNCPTQTPQPGLAAAATDGSGDPTSVCSAEDN
jgi:hypothetical protein